MKSIYFASALFACAFANPGSFDDAKSVISVASGSDVSTSSSKGPTSKSSKGLLGKSSKSCFKLETSYKVTADGDIKITVGLPYSLTHTWKDPVPVSFKVMITKFGAADIPLPFDSVEGGILFYPKTTMADEFEMDDEIDDPLLKRARSPDFDEGVLYSDKTAIQDCKSCKIKNNVVTVPLVGTKPETIVLKHEFGYINLISTPDRHRKAHHQIEPRLWVLFKHDNEELCSTGDFKDRSGSARELLAKMGDLGLHGVWAEKPFCRVGSEPILFQPSMLERSGSATKGLINSVAKAFKKPEPFEFDGPTIDPAGLAASVTGRSVDHGTQCDSELVLNSVN